MFDRKFSREKPAFRDFIDPAKTQGITDGFARLATLRKYIAHETGHSLITGNNLETRFGEETAWLKELYCDLLALAGYRQISGINPRESELALAMKLVDAYLDYEDRHNRQEYNKASTDFVNFLLTSHSEERETGSIRIVDGRFTWNNTEEVFIDIASLLRIVQSLLEDGKETDAKKLHEKYFHPNIYRQLL
jgi:hypothetical protein